MNILLINANPVVSRLLVLCTRDENLVLHEVARADDVKEDTSFDIIMVDDDSYEDNMFGVFNTFSKVKKIFISYNQDEMIGFDKTIKKPFLPSQITEIFQNTEELVETENQVEVLETQEPKPEVLDETNADIETFDAPAILDENEVEKIKALLDMDDEVEISETTLSDEELEIRKVEVIKEELISQGLEILEEDAIVEEFSIDLDGSVKKLDETKPKKSKKEKLIKKSVKIAMKNMTKEQRKNLLKGKEVEIRIRLKEDV